MEKVNILKNDNGTYSVYFFNTTPKTVKTIGEVCEILCCKFQNEKLALEIKQQPFFRKD